MKTTKTALVLLTVILSVISCSKNEEELPTIYANNLVFTTQKEIDDFGEKGYTGVLGSLTIGTTDFVSDAITNIEGLKQLESVGDDLIIINNSALTNLNGLRNLSNIEDFLFIQNNDALTNLNGLNNMTSVQGLSIYRNNLLTSLDGLSNKLYTIENVIIANNDLLNNIDGLSNLSSIGSLDINNNNSLLNLDGLSNISYFYEIVIFIHDNNSLRDFCAIKSLSVDLDHTSLGLLGIWGNFYNPTLKNLVDGNCSR